jgi:large subunit ribosomal protein L30
MIAVIRITGQIGLKKEVVETLNRLRLRKKYSCVVIDEKKKELTGMIKSVRDFTAYGKIDDETYKMLVEKRGKKDPKNPGEIKPYFALHPPRGGIDSKKHFRVGKGVLGDNKDKINDLIRRML